MADFDLATMRQNIYYFPTAERPDLLRHVRGFLKPGGRLLLTTECRGDSTAAARARSVGRHDRRLRPGCRSQAIWRRNSRQQASSAPRARSLIPGESFYAFVGTQPG